MSQYASRALQASPPHPSNHTRIGGGWARLALVFPAGVLTAFTLGRGVGNLALLGLGLLALTLTMRHRLRPPAYLWPLWAYLAVLALSTVLHGVDVAQGLQLWVRLALALAASLALAYATPPSQPLEAGGIRLLLLFSAIALGSYALRAAYHLGSGDWRPAAQLNGLHVAALAPLALLAWHDRPGRSAAYALLTLAVLVVGDSRSEILMLLSGLAAMLLFHHRRLGWLLPALPLALLLAEAYGALFRDYSEALAQDGFGFLDGMSGGRLILWRLAFDHPPENVWLGVGCGQSEHYFQLHRYVTHSFHNAFVETWYDAGLLGLGLLLLGLARLSRGLAARYRDLTGRDRWVYAGYFGALTATIVACLVDRGYMTVLFNVFLFHCLVVLHRFPAPGADRTHH